MQRWCPMCHFQQMCHTLKLVCISLYEFICDNICGIQYQKIKCDDDTSFTTFCHSAYISVIISALLSPSAKVTT